MGLGWAAGTGLVTEHFSRSFHPGGFFRKFSASRRGHQQRCCPESRDHSARVNPRGWHGQPHPPGTAATGPVSLHTDHSTAQKGFPGLAGGPPIWKNAPWNAIPASECAGSPWEPVWGVSAMGILLTQRWPWGLANDCTPLLMLVKREPATSNGFHGQGLLSGMGHRPSLLSVPSLKQRGWDGRGPVISDPLTLKTQQTNKPKGH